MTGQTVSDAWLDGLTAVGNHKNTLLGSANILAEPKLAAELRSSTVGWRKTQLGHEVEPRA
jgi:hypothetical protein